tara:strand:- start:104 stop:274 length:171 start_codon:yes stop_codon:yes gene_type:complete
MIKTKFKGKTYHYDYKSLYVNSDTHKKINEMSVETGLSMKKLMERIIEQTYANFKK